MEWAAADGLYHQKRQNVGDTIITSSEGALERIEIDRTEVTTLLQAWQGGDDAALERLLPLLYGQLHAIARRHLQAERPDHTLQPTALVHEAYLRLVGLDAPFEHRVHFLAVAARTMRNVLVDHARARLRQKRGGGAVQVTLQEGMAAAAAEPVVELIALDDALTRLAEVHERKAKVVELHYFGGLTHLEVAAALDVSPGTVDRDLRMARAWLSRELTG
jgi:RNA polymerase sigma factor (TIGR02999 family)